MHQDGSFDDHRLWVEAMGNAKVSLTGGKFILADLWVQALSEAAEDPELKKYLRRHLREVHDFIAARLRDAQAAGGILPDRDPEAEAWIMQDDSTWLCSFISICHVLGFDPDYLRQGLRRWRAERSVPPFKQAA